MASTAQPPFAPQSTYRLQIRASFDLYAATDTCSYLHALGVDAFYLSPLLAASAGSDHGYDVVDHSRVDPSRGGAAGLRHFLAQASQLERATVIDIVPNHAGVADSSENPAWWDVLKFGRDSAYASWFDIDWSQGPVLIPVLADDIDEENDLLLVEGELRYAEHRFPTAPGTVGVSDTPATVAARQHYRLGNYHLENTEQQYRRFFAVTTLAGLRVEDEAVFEATHMEVLRWIREEGVAGLRLDHPDGLIDPSGYLHRLRAHTGERCWITVEKILEPQERLPADWPVAGTTGYDALTEVSNVLLDPGAQDAFTQIYQDVTGDNDDFATHVRRGKRTVATSILQAELARLARLVPDWPHAKDALTELAVRFPVYRSYLPAGREHLDEAIALTRTELPELADTIDALAPRLYDPADELCARFQQTTGAVMAKGVEDTAYYRYARFVALNEVGGDPATFGRDLGAFHQAQAERHSNFPTSMTTLSTHDTKRSEDVRAALIALAEFPKVWADTVRQLMSAAPIPSVSYAYLLWQTFAGAGFIERERMHAYALKSMREAAEGTSWAEPNVAFENAVHAAVDSAYDRPEVHGPLRELICTISPYGRSVALAQKLIQLTMPGVPDVYQGTELWDTSLVDPDNRRAVDFDLRQAALAQLSAGTSLPGLEEDEKGVLKLLVVTRCLTARRDHSELFSAYSPIQLTGRLAEHLIGFDRGGAITLTTRLPATLERRGGWGTSTLELEGSYTDDLTGRELRGTVRLAEIFHDLPVALLLPN